MTIEEALEQLVRLAYVQKLAATEVKQNLSDNNYRLLDLARNETDFAGIASVIERLRKMANFVGGSPSPIPWDQLQQKYVDEIERLHAENVRLRKYEAQSNMQRDFAAKALRQQTRDLKEFYGDD